MRTIFRVAVLACMLLVSGGTGLAASAQAPQSDAERIAALRADTAAIEAGSAVLAEHLAAGRHAAATYRTRIVDYPADGRQLVLNDLKVTPGEADSQLTAKKLCAAGFHTASDRHVTESQKKRICAEYGRTEGCPGRGYEIDHLISIELGGSNSDANLWPQPVDGPNRIGFHAKDKVENALHRKVCAGEISLPAAQKCIAADWYSCAVKEGILP